MTTYRAGQEIDSYCTKCKMDLTHRIVAMVGSKPAKVECRTCKGIHMFRAPKSASSVEQSTSVAKAPRAASARAKAAAKFVEPPLLPPSHAHIQLYKISDNFPANTWLSHKLFGVGVVLRELAPTKIEVRFDSGTKVLVHNTVLP
jgi:hypothetical protein